MAKRAKCDKCKLFWWIEIMDQTPLKELHCPKCGGKVTPVYSPCNYPTAKGEPELGKPKEGATQ